MTMLSPAATYHAELREQLSIIGRALTLQRAVRWLARGIVTGAVLTLALVVWSWLQQGGVGLWPLPMLAGVPLILGLIAASATLLVRQSPPDLARRIDRAARLDERSTTALELGSRGDEFPLAIAQMRDAVEHLRRVDALEAFPLRVPRTELLTTFFVAVVAAIVAVSPNPWLLRARASNPAITIAHEQAQRVQRLADTIQTDTAPDLDALKALVSKGAKTVDARSNEPDAALNALQDLEDQVRQMSLGDDQLAAALAAIASALASDPATQGLSNAINTGDMRQISQAARDLSQNSASMSGQDQQRVSKVLRDASARAGRSSQSVATQLSDAADALDAAAAARDANAARSMAAGSPGGAKGSSQSHASDSSRTGPDALNNLADNAAAASERQRAASQLESSRNALERALGRTQSRSGTSGRNSSASSQGSSANSSAQTGDQSAGGGQGQSGDGSGPDGTNGSGSGGQSGKDQGSGGEQGGGSGYSTGGQNQNRTGPVTSLDTITTPQQVPSSGATAPDQSSTNPYLGEGGAGAAQAPAQNVSPSYSSKPTGGNDTATIPIGLRDLVKDYFSSLDQKGN
ncbi:MAG: hypothetical protein NVSMB2_03210 [Chloroflexota bacterium]